MSAIELHLPALQVVLPLIGAMLAAVTRSGRLAWAITLVVTWATAANAVFLVIQVMNSGVPISYVLGGWSVPIGIEYRVDQLNVFVIALVALLGAVVLPYAKRSVAHEIRPELQFGFYTMYLLCLAGLFGIAITGDAFNAFVFLEVSSLSTYVMIALGRHRRALLAAYQYLIMGTIGATFYVIGIGILYLITGTLNFADIATRLPEQNGYVWASCDGCVVVFDCWHLFEAGVVSAACLAAERLCLCAIRRNSVVGRHSHQSRNLPIAAHFLFRVWYRD